MVLRRGTGKGKSFLACTLRVIFRVTSDDLVISLPMGVSFNPQLQGQVLHDERRGQTCAHTCAHTRTHVVRTTRLSVFIHCAQWRGGGCCPGLSAGRPGPGKGIAVFRIPELLLWVGFCMRRKEGHLPVSLCSAPKGRDREGGFIMNRQRIEQCPRGLAACWPLAGPLSQV